MANRTKENREGKAPWTDKSVERKSKVVKFVVYFSFKDSKRQYSCWDKKNQVLLLLLSITLQANSNLLSFKIILKNF